MLANKANLSNHSEGKHALHTQHQGVLHLGTYQSYALMHLSAPLRTFAEMRPQVLKGEFVTGKEIPHIVAKRCIMMMMILHQMRHGRQANHATNHVRCTKTRKAGQSRCIVSLSIHDRKPSHEQM
jgi:hypothetical protein